MQLKVQGAVGRESEIQRYKKSAEEWEDKVKKYEEVVNKLEKKREQYEGEWLVVLLSSVNTMEADFDTQTTSPCPCPVSVQCGLVGVVTSVSMFRIYVGYCRYK